MSLRVLTWVLDNSESKLGARLVLLALAEYAHDDGTKAFPSVETIARKARLSERGCRDALRKLESDGMIEQTGQTKYGTNIYTVVMQGGADSAPGSSRRGGQITTGEMSQTAPDPRTEPKALSSSSKPAWSGRAPSVVNRKAVTVDEERFAVEVLDIFNSIAGKAFGSKEVLGKIVMRHREHPELTTADHRRIIEQQFKRPWWKGDPSPSVIYGNGEVFDRALNGVGKDKEAGEVDEYAIYNK